MIICVTISSVRSQIVQITCDPLLLQRPPRLRRLRFSAESANLMTQK
ncbi:hypothetical protein Patl1_11615 [Pistacia atlantica]|uniref:Uncharacterized protein n=1 Tax=Pistacia atlantica TaxID=434234 RepID=A0ACC1A440_9ROSI|nr:hypothetical protein Patl1_11615 [Pistacia atlantica]